MKFLNSCPVDSIWWLHPGPRVRQPADVQSEDEKQLKVFSPFLGSGVYVNTLPLTITPQKQKDQDSHLYYILDYIGRVSC